MIIYNQTCWHLSDNCCKVLGCTVGKLVISFCSEITFIKHSYLRIYWSYCSFYLLKIGCVFNICNFTMYLLNIFNKILHTQELMGKRFGLSKQKQSIPITLKVKSERKEVVCCSKFLNTDIIITKAHW